jgi:hypothetical protein
MPTPWVALSTPSAHDLAERLAEALPRLLPRPGTYLISFSMSPVGSISRSAVDAADTEARRVLREQRRAEYKDQVGTVQEQDQVRWADAAHTRP